MVGVGCDDLVNLGGADTETVVAVAVAVAVVGSVDAVGVETVIVALLYVAADFGQFLSFGFALVFWWWCQ